MPKRLVNLYSYENTRKGHISYSDLATYKCKFTSISMKIASEVQKTKSINSLIFTLAPINKGWSFLLYIMIKIQNFRL